MSTLGGWLSYASYPTMAGNSVDPIPSPPQKTLQAHNLDELSVADIKAFVNAGELTAEEVYNHELAAEHPRKTLLHLYAPPAEEAAAEEPGE